MSTAEGGHVVAIAARRLKVAAQMGLTSGHAGGLVHCVLESLPSHAVQVPGQELAAELQVPTHLVTHGAATPTHWPTHAPVQRPPLKSP